MKSFAEFDVHRAMADGRSCSCSKCNLKKHSEWRKSNREKAKIRDRKSTLSSYGINLDIFNRMNEEQGGVCKICGSGHSDGIRYASLHVDHCHTTKKVRGLLCDRCNRGIGMFKDDPDIVFKAAQYLRASKGDDE